MANVEGLRTTLEYIKEHPEEWDQQRWHTCFAGVSLRVLKGAELTEADCCNSCGRLTLDGRVLWSDDIADRAVSVLELTSEQDAELFDGGNALEDLDRIVAEISAEETVSA